MWDLPRPGPEPVSPALAGRLPTTAPPGKPLAIFKCTVLCHYFVVQLSSPPSISRTFSSSLTEALSPGHLTCPPPRPPHCSASVSVTPPGTLCEWGQTASSFYVWLASPSVLSLRLVQAVEYCSLVRMDRVERVCRPSVGRRCCEQCFCFSCVLYFILPL